MNKLLAVLVFLGILISGCTLFEEAPTGCAAQARDYVCGADGNTYTNACYAEQAGTTVAHSGICGANDMAAGGPAVADSEEEARCSDSDNGKNLMEAGVVYKGGSQRYYDYCVGSNGVQEYFCEDNDIRPETMLCPQGTYCDAGLCSYTSGLCSDTDSNLIVQRGTVTKGLRSGTDFCVGDSVVEYYCEGGTDQFANETIDCNARGFDGCMNGACVESGHCYESDDGYDIYEAGTVQKGGVAYSDYCSSDSIMYEYFCSGGVVEREIASCVQGYHCVNGECVDENCRDSDGGRDEYNYGEVTYGGDEWDDYCHDSDTVKEYYCHGGEVESELDNCGSGYECSGGECRAERSSNPVCTDSDGGLYRYERGLTTNGGYLYADGCTNSYTVFEYYCEGSIVRSTDLSCGSDEYCDDGECVQESRSCSDSDGDNMYVVGSVTWAGSTHTDRCDGTSKVIEWVCEGNEAGNKDEYCPSGYECAGGRCVQMPTCSDSDGGKDIYERGTASGAMGSGTDYCAGTSGLHEYYCDGYLALNDYFACPSGYACSNGACVREETCSDSDGGINYETKGTAKKGGSSSTDYCSNGVLLEYYCSGNSITYTQHQCDGVCAEGRCTYLTTPPLQHIESVQPLARVEPRVRIPMN